MSKIKQSSLDFRYFFIHFPIQKKHYFIVNKTNFAVLSGHSRRSIFLKSAVSPLFFLRQKDNSLVPLWKKCKVFKLRLGSRKGHQNYDRKLSLRFRKQLSFTSLKDRLRRRSKKTKLKSYIFAIYRGGYYTRGFERQNFRRFFTRNFLNLRHATRTISNFKQQRRFFSFCRKVIRRDLYVGKLGNLFYYLKFQFFFLVFFMNYFGKTSKLFLRNMRLVVFIRFLFPHLFRNYSFFWFVTRYIQALGSKKGAFVRDAAAEKLLPPNPHFDAGVSLSLVLKYPNYFGSLFLKFTRFLRLFQKKFIKIILKIKYLYRVYLRQFLRTLNLKFSAPMHSLLSSKRFIRKRNIHVNGRIDCNTRKLVRYGDSLYVRPKRFIYFFDFFSLKWAQRVHFRSQRLIRRSVQVPWCSFVLHNDYLKNKPNNTVFAKYFSKKFLEIYFVLERYF